MGYVLITGCSGMIGSKLAESLIKENKKVLGIDKKENTQIKDSNFCFLHTDLSDAKALEEVFESYEVSGVIHLAALAHTEGESDLSWEKYKKINVECSENVFVPALKRGIPVLFISSIDVYGITEGVVDTDYECKPISNYAKSKLMAEKRLAELCNQYSACADIYRLSPVYTDEIKRDIQKRYYLKYPKLAYKIGKGMDYEFLYIENAVDAFIKWVKGTEESSNNAGGVSIYNIKDAKAINTSECIADEKRQGRANIVLPIPKWCVAVPYTILRKICGDTNFIYLLNKVINPIKTK